jgi:hypothetical protein
MKAFTEQWWQDSQDTDLWHGEHGVIINTAALDERKAFYTVIRLPRCTVNNPTKASAGQFVRMS